MSTQEPSKCCVCGEPTTKRCQACAKSGIDLFFCSPEHQKLVWKHHKEVCGPNALHVPPPPLTVEEARMLAEVARRKRPGHFDRLPPLVSQIGRQLGVPDACGQIGIARSLEIAAKTPPGSFETVVLPQLLRPPPSLDVWTRYLLLTKARHILLAHNEVYVDKKVLDVGTYTIWAQVARLQLNSYMRNFEMAHNLAPHARLTSMICHRLLILITLVRLKQSNTTGIPLAWIKRAFERFADLLTEIKPFESEQDMHGATLWHLQRILPLTAQPYRAVRQPGTDKLVFRFID